MRGLIALLIALVIGIGIYYLYVKQVQPAGPGTLATQAIDVTAVQNDLLAIAQAERMYFAQNGSYGSLDELTSSGTLTLPRAGRYGYTYSIETSAGGFTVTARHAASPGNSAGGAAPLHYPTITVDQTMQVRQID